MLLLLTFSHPLPIKNLLHLSLASIQLVQFIFQISRASPHLKIPNFFIISFIFRYFPIFPLFIRFFLISLTFIIPFLFLYFLEFLTFAILSPLFFVVFTFFIFSFLPSLSFRHLPFSPRRHSSFETLSFVLIPVFSCLPLKIYLYSKLPHQYHYPPHLFPHKNLIFQVSNLSFR